MTYDTLSHDTHASPFFSNPWDQPMGFCRMTHGHERGTQIEFSGGVLSSP